MSNVWGQKNMKNILKNMQICECDVIINKIKILAFHFVKLLWNYYIGSGSEDG
jgi:hypothetical protein